MKKLSVPILIVAALGLATLFMPNGGGPSMFAIFFEFDRFRLFLMLLAFALPIAAAVGSLRATAPRSWHGIVAMAGFAIATIKSQVWSMIRHFGDIYVPMKVQAATIICGVVLSLLAVAKDD